MRVDHKVVSIIANLSVKERCPVYLLDLYISKLPKQAKEKNLFYCRPLQSTPKSSTEPWYSAIPIGRNMLQNMVRQMCEEADISGWKTNHSLRVCGTTSLFAAGVTERVIQGRSGHSSSDALRKYERVTETQKKSVAKILTGETDHYESVPSSRPTSVLPNNSVRQPAASSSVMYKDCVVNMYSAPYFPPFPHYPPYQMPPGPSSNDSYPPYQMPPGPPSNNSWSSNDKLLLNSYISYLFTHFIYSLQERGFMPSLKGYCNYLLLYFTLILLVLYHFSKGIYYLAN